MAQRYLKSYGTKQWDSAAKQHGNLCDSDLIDQPRLQETLDGYAAVDIQVLPTLGGLS